MDIPTTQQPTTEQPTTEQPPAVSPSTVPPSAELGPLEPYIRWARVLFAVLAAVAVVGLVVAALAGGTVLDVVADAARPLALLVIGVAIFLIAMVGLVLGLGERRVWAIHAVAPVCYALLAFGLIRSGIALTGGQILFPLEAIGAALVLTRPHGRELLPTASDDDRRRVWLVVAAVAATSLAPLLPPLLVR